MHDSWDVIKALSPNAPFNFIQWGKTFLGYAIELLK